MKAMTLVGEGFKKLDSITANLTPWVYFRCIVSRLYFIDCIVFCFLLQGVIGFGAIWMGAAHVGYDTSSGTAVSGTAYPYNVINCPIILTYFHI